MLRSDLLEWVWLLDHSVAAVAVKLVTQLASDTVSMESTFYALEDFAAGELVLVRNVNRKEPWWPVCAEFDHAADNT